ncbi:hypothetical protein CBS147322_11060 [Aspergillus niger]|nr:hypothetical protein CBS147322_11060 [Aspergillus niger]
MTSPDAHDYADDAYEVIKSLVLGHGHTFYQTTYFDLIHKRRSDYSTVEQYVEAFKHAYNFAKKLKVGISPYCGLLHLLKELESDLPTDRDDKIISHLQASKNVLFVRTKDPDLALAAVDPLLLHRRYGHAGFRRITTTAKDHQIELKHRDTLECEACSLGKATRLVSKDPIPKTNNPTQLWHADIQKVTPISHGRFNYFLLIVNNATRLVRTAMLKHKDDTSDELIRMNIEHKNIVGRYVATWHLDGGREFNRFRK